MSGTTGAAGGAAPGGAPYGGVPQPPAEHPAATTSLMSAMGPGGGYNPAPAQPPVPPGGGPNGYSPPTTYTKGQPTPARGTRVNSGAPQGGAAPRRPAPAAPAGAPAGVPGRTRRARLRVLKADPWSVMKVSFLLSLAIGIIMIVAVAVLWSTLDSLGVFSSVNNMLKDATGSGTGGASGGINLMDYIGFSKVLTYTALIAVVDVVLLTALCTLSAFIYNAAAGFTGGIELTLAEEE
ncbi:DUF3566 domain-containing protein [Kitasatospora sp. NBC_01287]|uniref:DUF3566 domain-containing protein n=1 Tax=Kitasatospora sp. NBC_01287 TaxID=2903573 RepID=UPI0022551FFC|nr:DUF3566 domain-containing protein [Kitasatospora sp. NBC_01287]MCX4747679.1 DUF3566 domain-containing protein [Kitasatospora sp. NBC_01287]